MYSHFSLGRDNVCMNLMTKNDAIADHNYFYITKN